MTTDPPAPTIHPERMVGRYELFMEIATGGMASVHLGRVVGAGAFVRVVAIKRLHRKYAKDPEFVAMLVDEARVISRIKHPNVLPVLDLVEEDDELFIVMEYLEGETFARLLRRARKQKEPVPPRVALSVVCDVLRGLEAAHQAKNERGERIYLIHRDVAPDNIMVGVDGFARLLDFGVAKAMGRHTASTQGGVFKGKLPYMTPEQVRGEPLSSRTDIFSASVVLWRALAGRPLFKGNNLGEYAARVLDMPIEPPSKLNSQVPRKLDAIVLRGLERAAEERWSSGLAMAEAIEAAVPLASPREVGKWVRETAEGAMSKRAIKVSAVENAPAIDPAALRASQLDPVELAEASAAGAGADEAAVSSSDALALPAPALPAGAASDPVPVARGPASSSSDLALAAAEVPVLVGETGTGSANGRHRLLWIGAGALALVGLAVLLVDWGSSGSDADEASRGASTAQPSSPEPVAPPASASAEEASTAPSATSDTSAVVATSSASTSTSAPIASAVPQPPKYYPPTKQPDTASLYGRE